MERPNTLSGLKAKRDELIRYRDQLEADVRAVTVDIDHLEAAIRIFDPEEPAGAGRRYRAAHRAQHGQTQRFLLTKLREATGPLTAAALADTWCAERGLAAKDATIYVIRQRIRTALKTMERKGLARQDGHVQGLIGWRGC